MNKGDCNGAGVRLPNGSVENANPLSGARGRALALALLASAALVLAACGARSPSGPEDAAPKTVADFFPIPLGGRPASLQVAVLEPEQARGLMERRDLGADQGMIFVNAYPQQLRFWMHDTPTPLDIGYFAADGELAEIYPLRPFDEQTVASRRGDLQFAVEMNRGWFSAHGVHPGDKLDLKALARALKARGFNPRTFGLQAP